MDVDLLTAPSHRRANMENVPRREDYWFILTTRTEQGARFYFHV